MRTWTGALACAALSIGSTAHAAPTGVKLSWASPDASTTMAVSWVTTTNLPTTIEYGIASVAENMLQANPPMDFPGIGWFHEVEIVGLQPNTVYKYRVGSTGDWSPEYEFRTAPNDQCTPFTFVVLGDARSQFNQGPSPNWPGIHGESAAVDPRFILNTGDLVNEGTDIDQWANWLVASAMVNPTVPMLPALGNHDDGPGDGMSANYNRLFVLPTNTVTGTEDYWYVVYNNIVIFSLSTQTFEDYPAQAAWVEGVAAQHPNKWKVAFFHHPVYTSESFGIGHEPNEQGQNPAYGPAFDNAGIDVVAMGHNHHYERFAPLRYDANDPAQGAEVTDYGNGPGEGRLYVISGGAGSFTNPLITAGGGASGTAVRSADHHFVKITVNGGVLAYSAISTNAGNTGGGGGVLDSLTITRPNDPCGGGVDVDMDGFSPPLDCDDTNELVNPGAAEVCDNAVDEDCDGTAQACPMPIPDMDGDGSPMDSDCDDNDADRFPSNPEVDCDGIDNDCDCIEPCNGVDTNVCTPAVPDAGTPDSGPSAEDMGTAAADSGGLADAGEQGNVDSGSNAAPDSGSAADTGQFETIDDGCSCSAHDRQPPLAWAWLALGLALVFRRRR